MIQASQERMQTLEENKKQMIETISKFASSSTTSQVQPANSNRSGNTSDIAIILMINIGNGENTSNLPFENINVVNPSIVDTSTTVPGTFTMLLVPLPWLFLQPLLKILIFF